MRILKTVVVILALSALPLHAAEDTAMNQIVDRIVSTENTEMNSFKAYSPLVETYIQNLRGDAVLGTVPNGDKYFLGHAVLAQGVNLEPLTDGTEGGGKHKVFGGLGNMLSLSMEYLPQGFLQMVY